MGSIEYILTNIAGIDKETIELLRGNRPGESWYDFIGKAKHAAVESNFGKNTMNLLDSILKLDSASTDKLGSSELTDNQKGSIDGLFGLSAEPKEAAN